MLGCLNERVDIVDVVDTVDIVVAHNGMRMSEQCRVVENECP